MRELLIESLIPRFSEVQWMTVNGRCTLACIMTGSWFNWLAQETVLALVQSDPGPQARVSHNDVMGYAPLRRP